jgi:hypothetical protein
MFAQKFVSCVWSFERRCCVSKVFCADFEMMCLNSLVDSKSFLEKSSWILASFILWRYSYEKYIGYCSRKVNMPGLFLWGAGFRSRFQERLYWVRIFVFFSQHLRTKSKIISTGLNKALREAFRVSRKLAHEGCKVVSPTNRLSLFATEDSWYSSLLTAESILGSEVRVWPE